MAKPDGPPGKPDKPGKPDHAGNPRGEEKKMTIIRDSTQEYRWAARERITVSNTAVGFTAATYKPTTGDFKGICANIARCVPESADIRYRVDGTDPTASVGRRIYEDGEFYIIGTQNIKKFKAIRTNTDATLDVEYGW